MYKQKITMEINKPYILPIAVKQYDSDRVLEIALTDKGAHYSLVGCTVKLCGKKLKKNEIVLKATDIIDSKNGVLKIYLTNTMLDTVGISIYEIIIISSTGGILSTIPFSINVIGSVRTQNDMESLVEESKNEINAFEQALIDIAGYEGNMSQFKNDINTLITEKLDNYKATFDNYITNMSVSTVKEMREHYNKTYPLGAIYESTDSTSPETLFGGTWEAYGTGCTTVGVGEHTDLNGNTMTIQNGHEYGTYNHTLTIDELAQHSHSQKVTHGNGSDGEILRIDYGSDANGTGAKYEQGVNTGEVGGNKSFDLMQPSIGVYRWRRTALASVEESNIIKEISQYLIETGIDFGSYLNKIAKRYLTTEVEYSFKSGLLIRPSTSTNYTPYGLATGQSNNYVSLVFEVEKDVEYKVTKTTSDTFRGAIYNENLVNGATPLQVLVEDETLTEFTFTSNFDGKAVFLLTKTNEGVGTTKVTVPGSTYIYKIKPSAINNLNRGVDASWEGWNELRYYIGGLYQNSMKIPFETDSPIDVKGMIIGGGSHTENRRWGQHVLELYGEDDHQRVTLLLDRRTGDRMEEDNVANTAELYMYLPSDVTGVTAESYGWFRIGSDVAKHSVMFRRDKCLAYAELDLRSAITLARINTTTDLDRSCSTVAEADAKYQPERYPVENAKCIRYIQLKNAENGTMFYDTNRDKVVVKVAGTWCDMNVTPVASGTYDF